MCGDTNCQTHDCDCSHGNHKCTCHVHEENLYNGYNDGDVVRETDFQIVDKYELDEMRNNGVVGGNLRRDLVEMGFITEDDDRYEEMENEKREGMFYTEE